MTKSLLFKFLAPDTKLKKLIYPTLGWKEKDTTWSFGSFDP